MRSMRLNRRKQMTLAAAMCAVAYSGVANATQYTWLNSAGGNNNWTTATNWTSGGANVAPPATPAVSDTTDLVFDQPISANNTSSQNTGPIVVNSMTFSYTPTGTATIAISASSTGTQEIQLGAGGLVSTAGGTVAFSAGANRTLTLTADQVWSNSNTSAIVAMRRAVSGAFVITKEGPGTISFEASNPGWSGGLNINDGFIRLSNASDAIGPGPITSNTANATGITASGSSEVVQNVAGAVTLGGTGVFSLGGSWKINLQNTVTLLTDKVITVGGFNVAATQLNREISGNVVGAGGLFKAGGGTLLLTGAANTFGGNAGVSNGTLEIANFGLLGAGTLISLGDTLNAATFGTLRITTANQSTNRPFATNIGGGNLDYAGDLTINNSIAGTGPLTKLSAGELNVNSVQVATFTMSTGVTKMAPDGSDAAVSSVRALVLGGATDAWTSKLDLDNNSLIVNYDPADPNPFAQVANQLKQGYNAGAWNGTGGITSSAAAATTDTALGYAEASVVLGPTGGTFKGHTVDGDAVLVRYTYYGDADLNGAVDTVDFNLLAANFSGTGKVWSDGDFNFDGNVDTVDFNLLAANFSKSLPGDSFGSLVPEPAGLIGVGLLGFVAARRRQRR